MQYQRVKENTEFIVQFESLISSELRLIVVEEVYNLQQDKFRSQFLRIAIASEKSDTGNCPPSQDFDVEQIKFSV